MWVMSRSCLLRRTASKTLALLTDYLIRTAHPQLSPSQADIIARTFMSTLQFAALIVPPDGDRDEFVADLASLVLHGPHRT